MFKKKYYYYYTLYKLELEPLLKMQIFLNEGKKISMVKYPLIGSEFISIFFNLSPDCFLLFIHHHLIVKKILDLKSTLFLLTFLKIPNQNTPGLQDNVVSLHYQDSSELYTVSLFTVLIVSILSIFQGTQKWQRYKIVGVKKKNMSSTGMLYQ